MIAWGAVWQGLLIRCTFGWEIGNVHLETSDVRALTDEDQRWRMIDPALAAFTSTSTNAKIALLRKVGQAIGYDPAEILSTCVLKRRRASPLKPIMRQNLPPMRIW